MKNSQDFNHFGHEHLLIPLLLDKGDELYCKACELLITDELVPFHGCLSCNYYLHDKCLNIPRSILHPSHPNHPLTLLPIPTYPSSSFTCNACQTQGHGFSYTCAFCEFDIHLHCASFPAKVKVPEHHPHQLRLAFESVVQDCRKYYSCLFKCGKCGYPLEDEQWMYYCSDCDFGRHLRCVEIDCDEMGFRSDTYSGLFDGKSGTAQAILVDSGEDLKLSASMAKLVKYL